MAHARARATEEIRREYTTIGADHLVTFTYRDNVVNREKVLGDLERLRRILARTGWSVPYVAVRGFQDIRLLRRCRYQIVGNAQGQVNVKGPRTGTSVLLFVGDHGATEHLQLVIMRHAGEVAFKMYRLMWEKTMRRLGDSCTTTHWMGGAGDVRMDRGV